MPFNFLKSLCPKLLVYICSIMPFALSYFRKNSIPKTPANGLTIG